MTLTITFGPKLNDLQEYLLQHLFDEGGLSTRLLETYVAPTQPTRQVQRTLQQLRERGLLRSEALGLEEDSELCWTITYDGARALGRRVSHVEARYRMPSTAHLAHKALALHLRMILDTLSWKYLRPQGYNPGHPKPDDTPQREALRVAVGAHFARHVQDDAVPSLHPSQVPAGLNDWVAWPEERPQQAVVLIQHPVGGTQHFWHTRQLKKRKGRAAPERIPGRTRLYADLARILPVYGVFASLELVRDYSPFLKPMQIRPCVPDDLLPILHTHSLQRGN